VLEKTTIREVESVGKNVPKIKAASSEILIQVLPML
jgi:hypothetical protein